MNAGKELNNLISDNYRTILQLIDSTRKKYQQDNHAIQLIAVSKKQSIEKILLLNRLGQQDFAENYLQEAIEKINVLDKYNNNITWHYIGRIQSNKLKAIAEYFNWIHSITSFNQAELINNYLNRINTNKKISLLIQVNLEQDHNKNGIDISSNNNINSLVNLVNQIKKLTHTPDAKIILKGFMGILKITNTDFGSQYNSFKKLSDLSKQLNLDILSMGMSNDYEAAIAAGSNMLRIGTKLFGERN
ncbi:MAG: YggS family pyridoxal phosphate-dependent enzyme [Gammaproteobacteria bacterium]|nr:YggS family pyridoxal phosphate-dependent enzyme [Gammaproteobacteria bacterium]